MSQPSTFSYSAPTKVPHALRALAGARILRLTRYSWWPGSASTKELPIRECDVFAYTAGPLLVELGSGVAIRAGSDDTDWGSVVLRFERDAEGNQTPDTPLSSDPDFHPIVACDPVYSDSQACALIGRTVRSVVVYRGALVVTRPHWPCEVAVQLIMDNGEELVLCHGLRDGGSDEFSVRTKSRIPAGYLEGLKEVYRL